MYKQITWDWNGTLWNDTWLCVEINNHMLERRKLPPEKWRMATKTKIKSFVRRLNRLRKGVF